SFTLLANIPGTDPPGRRPHAEDLCAFPADYPRRPDEHLPRRLRLQVRQNILLQGSLAVAALAHPCPHMCGFDLLEPDNESGLIRLRARRPRAVPCPGLVPRVSTCCPCWRDYESADHCSETLMGAPARPHIGSPSHRVPLLGRRYKEDSAIRRCGRTPAQVRTTPHSSRIELRAHLQWPCFVRAGQACRGQDAGERSERRSIDAGHGRPDRCRPRRAADECGGGALRGDRPTHRPPSREGREPGTEP